MSPDPNVPGAYVGGALPEGIYDVSSYERTTPNGSWNEVMVVDNQGKFTSTRQIDTGGAGGAGPITYRSGTIQITGNSIKFTVACHKRREGANVVDGDGKELNQIFTVTGTGCETKYLYGASGIRTTLKRRK
jgi:hypothetical protein